MQTFLRRVVLSLLLLPVAAPVFSPRAAAADYVLRFASLNAADAPMHRDILEPLARQIEQESGGRIQIDLKPIGGFGKPADYFTMVERGDIEIAYAVQGYNADRFPQSTVMELPLMYNDSVSGTKAFWQLYQEGLLAKDYANVKILALFVLPPYGLFTVNRNVATLRDLRGLRMRTPSPTVGLALPRLGTIPIGLPVNALGENIAGGTIDAIAFGWDSLHTTQGAGDKTLEDMVKYLVDVNFAAPSLMVVMNKAKYEALPEDLRKIIDQHTGGDFSVELAKFREVNEAVAKARLRKDPAHVVVTLTPAQREEMRTIIAPVVADWANGLKKQGIDADRLLARAKELVGPASTN
jgi:TRAP-type C4-dicarboxylate transport system substrate-binding protein